LRHRHEHRPHAGRSRAAVLRHPRADPTDRGEGAAEAEAPEPVAEAEELSRPVTSVEDTAARIIAIYAGAVVEERRAWLTYGELAARLGRPGQANLLQAS